MLELKKVSKFYYNKGVVSSAFRKLDLKLNIGELVAITGESGSGKSTLVNVISGLDSYEEGEMYVYGNKTSHYGRKEFEEYRKKYVSNIFQDFNLVSSYNVYQNIELVLELNGYKSKEVKQKILDVIEKVGLTKYKKTKVSKLSGGQKQRVAIARALVKDSPIIVADEPTGNIDSKSAETVMQLLAELSKERLVVVVTHNYEQIAEYATRRIKMHDGRIIEDTKIRDNDLSPEELRKIEGSIKSQSRKKTTYKDIRLLNKIKLGVRNTFNIIPKFVILFIIFLFITLAVMAQYSSYKKVLEENKRNWSNMYFADRNPARVIIQKKDKSFFTDEDYAKINSISNIENLIKDDKMVDKAILIALDDISIDGYVRDLNSNKRKIEHGRKPTAPNEIILETHKDDWMIQYGVDKILNKEFNIASENSSRIGEEKVKLVGITYNEELKNTWQRRIYLSTGILDEIKLRQNIEFSTVESFFADRLMPADISALENKVVPNKNVPKGKAYVKEEYDSYAPKNKAKGQKVEINVKNQFFADKINLEVAQTYNKDNFTKLLGIKDYKNNQGPIFINEEEYRNLFNKGYYQSSVYIKNQDLAAETLKELDNLNIKTLYMKNSLVDMAESYTLFYKIFNVVVLIIVLTGVFFISYFLIKIVFKSRNTYYTTLRMLGASKKVIKQLLNIELFAIQNIAFFTVIGAKFAMLSVKGFTYIKQAESYLTNLDYIILYVILLVLSILVTGKYSKELFKKTAISTYGEEV